MQEFITAGGPDYSEFHPVRLPVVRSSPDGQVQLIPGARSVFQFNREREAELAVLRRDYWQRTPGEEALDEVRRLAGIRRLDELPLVTAEDAGTLPRAGHTIHKLVLHPEPGIRLPALRFVPDAVGRDVVLYLHGEGQAGGCRAGRPHREAGDGRAGKSWPSICEAWERPSRPRGSGATVRCSERTGKNSTWPTCWGRSYLGMRAEEILAIARHLASTSGPEAARSVHLVGIGEAGPAALHAAALEPALFASLELRRSLVSWSNVIQTDVPVNQLVNTVHGALRKYDLPDLLRALSGMKVTVVEPAGGDGERIG